MFTILAIALGTVVLAAVALSAITLIIEAVVINVSRKRYSARIERAHLDAIAADNAMRAYCDARGIPNL